MTHRYKLLTISGVAFLVALLALIALGWAW